VPKLKAHIYRRLTGSSATDSELAPGQLDEVQILDNKFYSHKICRINYTTYDMRRAQDSINPRTRSDIIVLSDNEEEHPLWYARVIHIFHVKVYHNSPDNLSHRPVLLHVLWVRWYGYDYITPGGFSSLRLHRVGFGEYHSDDSFGFVNPADVVRAVHLIPVFALGKTPHLLPAGSMARHNEDEDEDYSRYYVNM
jgi:hypothetical protein